MQAGLYIVGTPIGNLQDITLRALDVLRTADYILAEDTRHTQRLLGRHEIRGHLISCHKFNENSRSQFVLEKIHAGQSCALVSNAGMPGISDPGARLAHICQAAGVYVTVIPGPSSATAAVALSGYGGAGFAAEGFLPRKPGPRLRRLEVLLTTDLPVAIFESPYRLVKLLGEIKTLAPKRLVCVARELTKINEECVRGTAEELEQHFAARENAARIKGEIVLVIAAERMSR